MPTNENPIGSKTLPEARMAAAKRRSRSLSASRCRAARSRSLRSPGEHLGSGARGLAHFSWHWLVGFGEQEIEDDDFRLGVIERFERPGEKGARKRPAAEASETSVIDHDQRHVRPRRARPSHTEPQVKGSR